MSALPSREMKFIQTPDGQKPVWNNSSLHQFAKHSSALKRKVHPSNSRGSFPYKRLIFEKLFLEINEINPLPCPGHSGI